MHSCIASSLLVSSSAIKIPVELTLTSDPSYNTGITLATLILVKAVLRDLRVHFLFLCLTTDCLRLSFFP